MRVCFISVTNLFICPYIKKYQQVLSENHELDVILWDRHNVEETLEGVNTIYKYEKRMDEQVTKLSKICNFFMYGQYCKKILDKEKYDKIIVLHNVFGVFLGKYLRQKYNKHYIIDIRDYSYENNKMYYFLEKKVIAHSGMAVISSKGYLSFLPAGQYVVAHNDSKLSEDTVREIRNRQKKNGPICLSFIGLVRFIEKNQYLIRELGNDERFVLAYFGQNSELLEKFTKESKYTNVAFAGRFEPAQTIDFYKKTDIINNYYGNSSLSLKRALSNKLYYAAQLGIPILVCKGTYMEEISTSYGFGIAIDDSKNNFADSLYNAYMDIDREKLLSGCERFLETVRNDNRLFEKSLKYFIEQE